MGKLQAADQRHEELTAFSLFVAIAGWDVRFESIQQGIPDIACTLTDGTVRQMELVSLDALHTLRRMSNFERTQSMWERAISELSLDKRQSLHDRLDGATLGLHFVSEPDRKEMTGIFPAILDRLLSLPEGYVGPIFPLDGRHPRVAWSNLSRGNYHGGPLILAVSGSRPFRPDWTRIKDKLLRRNYRFGDGVELLAYSRYDTLLPTVGDVVPTKEIKQWLQRSTLTRVWVLDGFMRTIEAVITS
jgi:hypothetical protein